MHSDEGAEEDDVDRVVLFAERLFADTPDAAAPADAP